jgi:hypothetical protein
MISQSRPLGIPNRVHELLDRRQQLAQRLENHQIDRLVCGLHESRVRPEPEDLNVLAVGVADLPGSAVVDLRTVADGDDSVGLSQRSEVRVKHRSGAVGRLRRMRVALWEVNLMALGLERSCEDKVEGAFGLGKEGRCKIEAHCVITSYRVGGAASCTPGAPLLAAPGRYITVSGGTVSP